MKEKVKFYGSLFILLIFIPYLVTVYLHGGLPFGTGVDEQTEAQVTARLAAQIPADYEMECLKAQAVIVRTNLYREMEKEAGAEDGAGQTEDAGSGTDTGTEAADEGWDEAQMREVWGDDYGRNLEKLQEAVEETEGEILTWEGEPIQAAFHVASSGKTRNAAEVPGQEAYTYLQGADSEEDIRRPGFLYIGYMEKAEFAAALQQLFPNETMDAGTLPGALQIVERDSAGYVTRVQLFLSFRAGREDPHCDKRHWPRAGLQPVRGGADGKAGEQLSGAAAILLPGCEDRDVLRKPALCKKAAGTAA